MKYRLAALCLVAVVLLRTAWLAEDAFITFRTVDNWINGYGLTWNVSERVQAYSNPLWMFLVSGVYFFTHEIYYTSIFLSIFVSLAAVAVFALRVSPSTFNTLLAAACIISSKAFSDYSTSGLENPLSHLLLALFYAVYLRDHDQPWTVFWLALLAALAAINRLDSILLLGPACAYAAGQSCMHRRAFFLLLAGAAPLLIWELFSLFYYGFPFPNTAYAKLVTGVPMLERLQHGAGYLLDSLRLDPLTLIVTTAGGLLVFWRKLRAQQPLALGMAFYVLYVLYIGGGFMSGRFLTMPFWGGLMLLLHNMAFGARRGALVLGAAVGLALLGPHTPFLSGADYHDAPARGTENRDERGKFYPHTGLLLALQKSAGEEFPDHWWAVRGRALRRGNLSPQIRPGLVEGLFVAHAQNDSTIVAAWSNIGLSGFYAGPRVHIVDAIALADPLLARLPARQDSTTGAGHYGRIVPAGYLQTLVSGRNLIADQNLAAYYELVREVTRGELFSVRRLAAVWKLNTGQCDHLIQRHRYRYPTALDVALSDTRTEPGNPAPYIEIGRLYFEQGDSHQAVSALEQALQINPISFLNFIIVGRIFDQQNQTELAKKAYGQAIVNSDLYLAQVEGAGDEAHLLQTYLQLAEAHTRVGQDENIAASVRIYLHVLARDFTSATGAVYAQLGAFFRAIGMQEASEMSLRRADEKRGSAESP